jgi:hypothetical protein
MLERAERLMPADMAMQDAGGVVGRDPAIHQHVGVVERAVLEHRMQQRMHRVGVGSRMERRARSARARGASPFSVSAQP